MRKITLLFMLVSLLVFTANAQEDNKTSKKLPGDNGLGEAVYAKCSGCHGKLGKTKALGKSELIAGQNSADIESKLIDYKAKKLDIAGMGALMTTQVINLSAEDIRAVSAYISKF